MIALLLIAGVLAMAFVAGIFVCVVTDKED